MLRFYSSANSIWSCRVWSVYLTTLFTGQAKSSKRFKPVLCTFFRQKQMPFLNQRKGENGRRKYFMNKSPWKNVADPLGYPQPPDHQLDPHPTRATEASRWYFEIFFLNYFSHKIGFDISCRLYQTLSSAVNGKSIKSLLPADVWELMKWRERKELVLSKYKLPFLHWCKLITKCYWL